MQRMLVLVVCLGLCAAAASAQVTTATISGTVTDKSGAVVPGVEVAAVNVETNFTRTAKSDETGQYSIKFLPIGSYRVELNASGFKKFVQTGIVLELSRNARVDPVLEVGTLTETVSVTADAPMVNTSDAMIGQTTTNMEIMNLPLVNRDVYALLDQTVGVDSSSGDNAFGFPQQTTIINGSNNDGVGSVGYYLDGGSNMSGLRNSGLTLPNPDAVQEFRVITNGFTAEFGRFAGGVVDVVTKSGANAYHGGLFEAFRNDKLNAWQWLALSKSPLRQNQFGGFMGGRIVRDRTFFFASYSGLRERRTEYSSGAVVPTALERTGNFSASSPRPGDPYNNNAPFPDAMIPASRMDRVALRIVDQYVPLPNAPNNGYKVQAAHPTSNDEISFKLDHVLSKTHQLSGSYFRPKSFDLEVLGGNLPWTERQFLSTRQNFNVGDTWTKSATTVNQLRLSYLRNVGNRLNTPGQPPRDPNFRPATLADFGSLQRVQGAPALASISVSGYFSLGTAIGGPALDNFYQLRDTLSITRGRHNLKMGGEGNLSKVVQDTSLDNYGTFSFDRTQGLNALAGFLMGTPMKGTQDTPVRKTDSSWYYALFVQDDFRVHPRLVLNLGLRWEMQTPLVDPLNRKLAWDPSRQSVVSPTAPQGLLFPGDPGISRSVFAMDKNNFSPRIGLAWDPWGNGKTSIRAAYGVYYASNSGNQSNNPADKQPFATRLPMFRSANMTLTNPYADMPNGANPFPLIYSPSHPIFVAPIQVTALSRDYRWPYTHQMNFSVQRQLTQTLSLTASYVGALSHKLPFAADVNYPVWRPGARASDADTRRPYRQLSQVLEMGSIVNGASHSLQTSVQKRMSRNFSLNASYSFGKSLDSVGSQGSTVGSSAQNHSDRRSERARSDYDRRHNFVLSGIWELKYFDHLPRALRMPLQKWTVSSIATFRSGRPFGVGSGTDNNADTYSDRADYLGGPATLDPNRSRAEVMGMWFNTAAFQANAAGTYGNSGRNILDRPGMKNVNLCVFRNFKVKESTTLQVRADMSNAFNIVNLNAPNSTLTSPQLGRITGAGSMREAQLTLRLTF